MPFPLQLSQSTTSQINEDEYSSKVYKRHNNPKPVKPNQQDEEITSIESDKNYANAYKDAVATFCKDNEKSESSSIFSYVDDTDESKSATDNDDSDNDNLLFFQVLEQCKENILFAERGYKRIHRVCKTLQGELLKAKVTKMEFHSVCNKSHYELAPIGSFVAIKKINKQLAEKKVAIIDGTSFCVQESIIKEAMILKHLTVDNTPPGNYVLNFIDFFESDTHYYLVTEYVDGINLKDFVFLCHEYIKNGKLTLKHYQKTVKYIMWQLAVTIRSLHDIYQCMYYYVWALV